MTIKMANTVVRRMRESGLMVDNEYTGVTQDAETGEYRVELWQSGYGAVGRIGLIRTPQEWTALANCRYERRIGMLFA